MTTLLDLERYMELLHDETELLARALETEQFTAPIDACPGWSLAHLGYHVGDVVRFWSWVVTTGATTTVGEPEFPRPPDAQLAHWLRLGVRDLIGQLRRADPTAPAYSWTPQQDVAFVQRRVPHEVAVHRWDAEHAVRTLTGAEPRPIESDLAIDGISEYFLLASSFPVEQSAVAGTIALRCTDSKGCTDSKATWTAWLSDSRIQALQADTRDASVAISGAASDLLLTLWRRLPLSSDRVTVSGDVEFAQQFLSWANLA
ncbi:MAG: maleylpyruvate isomerase family mycothiol-dependent enzyme [Actinomycetes bacterium]